MIDPWGNPYGYYHDPENAKFKSFNSPSSFDIWTTAGKNESDDKSRERWLTSWKVRAVKCVSNPERIMGLNRKGYLLDEEGQFSKCRCHCGFLDGYDASVLLRHPGTWISQNPWRWRM